jgi:hypothetical protein
VWISWIDILHRGNRYVRLWIVFFFASLELMIVSRNDRYMYLGGPLLAGITVVALSSLAPMVLPMGIRALAISEAISLYGGLAVFGGFVLYE